MREVEFVVVGGGSGGAVVAGRLAERGAEVVLVEAGPDYGPREEGRWPVELIDATMLATTHDWGYTSGPVPGREPWLFERARVMGGCSSHNGAIAAVGHRSDYDAWDQPGWTSGELRPIFATVVERMRVRTYTRAEAGPFHARALEAAEGRGWRMAEDLCDLDANDSFGLEAVNVVDGVRWNTAFAYLDPVRGGGHLEVLDRMLVDRVEAGPDGVVVVARREGDEERLRAGTLVLAAGVYGTPAILQRSGVGDPGRLRAAGIEVTAELPAVGTNLHDHPMLHVGRPVGDELDRWLQEAAAAGFVPEEQTLGKAVSSLSNDGVFDLHVFPVCASTQTSILHGEALVEVACMTPRSRGRLDVTGPDPEAPPRIDHAYLTDPEGHDVQVMRDGLLLAQELIEHPALASALGPDPGLDVSDESIRRRVQHYYHPVGTCPMGEDPARSVCDARGRVHGLPGVVVADASLMPQTPRANTNLPSVMIGERIAGWLG